MKKLIGILVLGMTLSANAQNDKVSCATSEPDYVNRMPGFYISDCQVSEYKDYDFVYYAGNPAKAMKIRKGGMFRSLWYSKAPGETRNFSSSQVVANYFNAVTKIHGRSLANNNRTLTASINGKEVFIEIRVGDNSNVKGYTVVILEVQAMQQDVALNLDEAIERDGKVALYGIHFDTDKSTIKSESGAALKQVVDYLTAHTEARIIIVGHTDMVGASDRNLELSKARAGAVKDYLVREGKIDASRLSTDGVGYLCPVSTNQTEEGKALNRRVEIVQAF
jgi:outer membrane protein OmpA-like peptidoglycan-associated protein